MNRILPIAALVMLTGAAAHRAGAVSVDETQKNTAALIAIEHHWTQAEVHGDVPYVERLLAAGYESVNGDGIAHPKSAITASARKNGKSNKMALLVAAFAKSHPYGTLVRIAGDTAVVTFYSLKLGPQKGITSSDIFSYFGGRWHAVYSAHTAAKA